MYKLLPWDSGFFGVCVAAITEPQLSDFELGSLLDELRRSGVRLVYWPATAQLDEGTSSAFGGQLVDVKLTFTQILADCQIAPGQASSLLAPYNESIALADLESLSIQSGQYSRFSVDRLIPHEKFEELYCLWIRRSVSREMARETLVIQDGTHVAGMVTLTEAAGRGCIGLVAVAEGYRGRGYGEMLVRGAQSWFRSHDFRSIQVITQSTNLAARRLYERCGFSLDRQEHYYHFWL